jgi:hypothetical protein
LSLGILGLVIWLDGLLENAQRGGLATVVGLNGK